MKITLSGSCHCQAVRFTVESSEPMPFNRCYCSICRKTAGAGGFAINLGADHATMRIEGSEYLSVYRARLVDPATGAVSESPAERNFCKRCGSALWVWDPRWPDHVHPHASAIDTALPLPPSRWHMMLGSAANWAEPHLAEGDRRFDAYPDESLADWHRREAQ